MTRVIELFDRDNILCPEWLVYKLLPSEAWLNSIYSYEDGKHTWTLKTDMPGDAKITFDGEEYQLLGYHPELKYWHLFERTTKDYTYVT